MDIRGIIVGFFQMVAVLSAFPAVIWLINFLESPSLGGFMLLLLGLVIVSLGAMLCIATGGTDSEKSAS